MKDLELTTEEQLRELIADSAVTINYYHENNYKNNVLESHIDDILNIIKDGKQDLYNKLQTYNIDDVRNRIRIELEEDCKDFIDAYNNWNNGINNFVQEYSMRNNIHFEDPANVQFSARSNGHSVIIDLVAGTEKHSARYEYSSENPQEWEELSWGKFEHIILPFVKELDWCKKPLVGTMVFEPSSDYWNKLIKTNYDGSLVNAELCTIKQAELIAGEALEENVKVYKIIKNDETIDVLFKIQDESKVEFPAIVDIYFAYTHYRDEKFETKFKLVFFSLVNIKSESESKELLKSLDFFDATYNEEYTKEFNDKYEQALAKENQMRLDEAKRKHLGYRQMYGEEHYDYYMFFAYPIYHNTPKTKSVCSYIISETGTDKCTELLNTFMRFANIQGSNEYYDGEHFATIDCLSEMQKDLVTNWFAKDNWVPSDVLLEELGISKRAFEEYAYGNTSGEYKYKAEYIENLHWIKTGNVKLYNKLAVEWHSIARGSDKPFMKFAIEKNLIKNIK